MERKFKTFSCNSKELTEHLLNTHNEIENRVRKNPFACAVSLETNKPKDTKKNLCVIYAIKRSGRNIWL